MRHGKTLLIAVILVTASIGFLFLPLRAWFVQLQGGVGRLGAIGPVVVAGASVAMTVLLIPGSALTIGAGTLFGASIMASATPFCFCTTQKHLTVKRARSSKA